MPWDNSPSIQALRLQYNSALTARKACRRALTEVSLARAPPSAELLDAEAKSSALLEEARAKLLAAVTLAIMGGSDPQPPQDGGNG